MANSRLHTALLLLCAAAVCSCLKEPELMPDAGKATPSFLKVSLGDEATKASLTADGTGKTIVWSTDDVFRIYDARTGECATVKPRAVSADGFVATLPMPFERTDSLGIVVTYGAAVYRNDSTVIASSPVEQKLRIDGHDCTALPLSSVITKPDSNAVITLNPLNAMVEMTLLNTPRTNTDKIRNIHISTTMQKGTKIANISADQYIYMVDDHGFSFETTNVRSDKYIYEGDYANYIELTSDQLISYSSNICTYFQAAAFEQAEGDPQSTYIKTITIDITTDKYIISKTFSNVESARIKMTRGHITAFSLNMQGSTQTARLNMGVEWSPGYLTYDSATKRYCFAGPEERGLFFKNGSLMGFDPFASRPATEYFGHSNYLVYYKYQDADHSIVPSDYDLSWEEGTKDLKAYKRDAAGDIVPFKPSKWEDIDYIPYAEKPVCNPVENDPCHYVNEAGWRLPTADEVTALAAVVQENLGNWRVWSLGSTTINTTDHYPHMIEITDASGQKVTLSTTGEIDQSHSLATSGKYAGVWTYYVQQSYSESIYLPTSSYLTMVTSKGVKYVGDTVFMIGSLTSIFCNYQCDAKTINAKNSYNAVSDNDQGALMVRCVRDKK